MKEVIKFEREKQMQTNNRNYSNYQFSKSIINADNIFDNEEHDSRYKNTIFSSFCHFNF